MRYLVFTLAMLLLGAGFADRAEAQRTRTESGAAEMDLGDYEGLRHAIGVVDFSNDAGWRGRWRLGRNMAIMLESALQDTDRFVLVDREHLGDVMQEQDLAAGGRMAEARDVAQTGRLRPAKYIAAGSVTEVEESASGRDGGIGIGPIRVGGERKEAQIAVIVKLIDSTSGEIVAQERVVGRAGQTALRLGFRDRDVAGELGGFEKTPLGEAAQDCIAQAAKFIATQMEEFPFEGNVIRVANNGQILINRGAEFGVEEGQELVMRSEGEEIIDPMTGAVLGVEEGQVMGRLRVARVEENFAYCDVIDGETEPEVGSVVYLK